MDVAGERSLIKIYRQGLTGFVLNQNTGKRAYSRNMKNKKIRNVEKRNVSTELLVAERPRGLSLLRIDGCQCN